MRTTFALTPYALPAVVSLLFKAGIYFYARHSKIHNRQTRIYLLFLFSLSIQNLAELVIFHDKAVHMPSTWGGVLYFSASILAIAFLLHLALAVAVESPRGRISIVGLVLLYAPAAALQGLLWCTSLFVTGFEPMGYTYTKVPGSLYFTFELYALIYFIAAMMLLTYGARTQVTLFRRRQSKFLAIGLFPYVVVAITVIVLQHFGFRGFNATGTLPFGVTFFLIVTAYAIHQHRLFDIEFFIPWSEVRKRKTRLYARIQAVIAEISQLRSGQKALQALSDLFRCHVALIGEGRTVVAMSGNVATAGVASNFIGFDTFPQDVLDRVDGITMADEVVERDPALHRFMRHYGVGAVVPVNLPQVVGHRWLVLGNQFSEQVYTPRDFEKVEALFSRIADCFLDEFLSFRAALTTAVRRSGQAITRPESPESKEGHGQAHARSSESPSVAAADIGEQAGRRTTRSGYIYAAGRSRICGTGIYLPEERIKTQDLLCEIDSERRFGVSHHWLERVTGIREKRITPYGFLPSDMAVAAGREALERARLQPCEIDVIVYAGLTRDYLEPATAHIVQAKLGATNAVVFDVSNACHGFMNGVHMIDALIAAGQITYGLVVTGEQGSLTARKGIEAMKTMTTRKDFVLYATGLTLGDAGAAIVIGPKRSPDTGFMGFMMQSQGKHWHLCTDGPLLSGDAMQTDMPAIVRETGKLMATMFKECLYGRLGWTVNELTKFLIHQVSSRTAQIYLRHTGVPLAIIPPVAAMHGNLVTASIPLGLRLAEDSKDLQSGSKIYISSTGSGISLTQAGMIWDET